MSSGCAGKSVSSIDGFRWSFFSTSLPMFVGWHRRYAECLAYLAARDRPQWFALFALPCSHVLGLAQSVYRSLCTKLVDCRFDCVRFWRCSCCHNVGMYALRLFVSYLKFIIYHFNWSTTKTTTARLDENITVAPMRTGFVLSIKSLTNLYSKSMRSPIKSYQ